MKALVLALFVLLSAACCAHADFPEVNRETRQAFLQQPLQRVFAQSLESQQRVLPRPKLVQFIKLEPQRIQIQRVDSPIIVGPRLVPQQEPSRLRIQPQLIQRVDPLPASLQAIPSRPQIIQAIQPQQFRQRIQVPQQIIQRVEAPPQIIQKLEAPPQFIQRVEAPGPQFIQRVEAPPQIIRRIQVQPQPQPQPQIIQRIQPQPQFIQVQRVQPVRPQIVQVQAEPQVVQIQEQHLGQQSYASAYTGPQYRIIKQVQEIDPAGYYRYNFITENGIVVREQGTVTDPGTPAESTAKQGSYTYTGDDGEEYTVDWVADEDGFRASGAHLPTPPPIPEEIQRSLELNANDPTQYDEQGFPINARR